MAEVIRDDAPVGVTPSAPDPTHEGLGVWAVGLVVTEEMVVSHNAMFAHLAAAQQATRHWLDKADELRLKRNGLADELKLTNAAARILAAERDQALRRVAELEERRHELAAEARRKMADDIVAVIGALIAPLDVSSAERVIWMAEECQEIVRQIGGRP